MYLSVGIREEEPVFALCRLPMASSTLPPDEPNFSILRRTALALLKNESTLKVGVKNKRLTAAWDEAYLEQVLVGS